MRSQFDSLFRDATDQMFDLFGAQEEHHGIKRPIATLIWRYKRKRYSQAVEVIIPPDQIVEETTEDERSRRRLKQVILRGPCKLPPAAELDAQIVLFGITWSVQSIDSHSDNSLRATIVRKETIQQTAPGLIDTTA